VSALTGIMISKAVNLSIPKRMIGLNQERFSQWDPNIVHNQEATFEIIKIQVFRLFDRYSVLDQSPK
jgi:hypothetical protein